MEKLDFLKSILLGLTRGLAGGLPLSGEGHLLFIEKISGIALSSEGLVPFMSALRLGVIVAALVLCVKPIASMLRHPVKGDLKYVLPGAVPLLVLKLLTRALKWDAVLKDSAYMLLPYALLFTAVILFLSQNISKNRRIARTQHDEVRPSDAIALGLMQCLGVFSGVSLIGMGLSACLSNGLKPKKACDYAYKSLVPAMLIMYLPDFIDSAKAGEVKLALSENGYIMLAGLISAFVAGAIAIVISRRLIKKERLNWLSLYLAPAAIAIIALKLFGGM